MKPIEELDLSVSSYNRLKMAGIDTVEQLQNMGECQLLRLRHMTQRNVDEITQKVRLCAVTNADHIRSMSDEELAEHNVQDYLEYTVDYDWDDNPIGEYTPCFKTSDGAILWFYEDAVEYELNWLKRPYKEDT